MKLAYADPPYPGMSHLYRDHPDYGGEVDHGQLIESLGDYDGWVLHTASTTLDVVVPLLPAGTRIAAWVKPFASFKPGVVPAYAWEPVIFKPARRPEWSHTGDGKVCRDWIAESITLKRGLTGAKPAAVVRWALDCIGADPDDTLDDLFPGTGAVTEAWAGWRERSNSTQLTMEPT